MALVVKTILLVVGLLLVLTRLPAIFWPKQYIAWLERNFFGENTSRQRLVALVFFLLSVVLLYFLFQKIMLLAALAAFFSFLLLVVTGMRFLFPKISEAVFFAWKDNYLHTTRSIAAVVVVTGMALIYLAIS